MTAAKLAGLLYAWDYWWYTVLRLEPDGQWQAQIRHEGYAYRPGVGPTTEDALDAVVLNVVRLDEDIL